VSRIAFIGDKYPYIAPFLYVFDGNFMYFSRPGTGRRIGSSPEPPRLGEVEKYSGDLSSYTFVTLQGTGEVEDAIEKKIIRKKFVEMIRKKKLSRTSWQPSVTCHGSHRAIASEERSIVWKLTGVTDIVRSRTCKNGAMSPGRGIGSLHAGPCHPDPCSRPSLPDRRPGRCPCTGGPRDDSHPVTVSDPLKSWAFYDPSMAQGAGPVPVHHAGRRPAGGFLCRCRMQRGLFPSS